MSHARGERESQWTTPWSQLSSIHHSLECFFPSKNLMSWTLLTSVIIRGLVFPSWHQLLTRAGSFRRIIVYSWITRVLVRASVIHGLIIRYLQKVGRSLASWNGLETAGKWTLVLELLEAVDLIGCDLWCPHSNHIFVWLMDLCLSSKQI